MKNKPAYEKPIISKLDDKDSLLGGQSTLPEKCTSGSGDADGCYMTGNSAGIVCFGDGNSPTPSCVAVGNGEID